MKEVTIEFSKVNIPFNNDFIEMLGKQHNVTFDNDVHFFVKVVHTTVETGNWNPETYKYDDIEIDVYDKYLLKVVKCTNGYIGILNGNFACDYKGYTVLGICKVNI